MAILLVFNRHNLALQVYILIQSEASHESLSSSTILFLHQNANFGLDKR